MSKGSIIAIVIIVLVVVGGIIYWATMQGSPSYSAPTGATAPAGTSAPAAPASGY